MAPWKAVVDAKGKEVIGETRVFLDVECRTRECVMGNLVCDAMVDAVRTIIILFWRLIKIIDLLWFILV